MWLEMSAGQVAGGREPRGIDFRKYVGAILLALCCATVVFAGEYPVPAPEASVWAAEPADPAPEPSVSAEEAVSPGGERAAPAAASSAPAPAAEPSVSDAEPAVPGPEASASAAEPAVPAPESSVSAAEPVSPGGEQAAPAAAPSVSSPAVEPSVSGTAPAVPAPEASASAAEPAVPGPEPSVSAEEAVSPGGERAAPAAAPSVSSPAAEPSVSGTEPAVPAPEASVSAAEPAAPAVAPTPSAVAPDAAAAAPAPFSAGLMIDHMLSGGESRYVTQEGDSFASLGSRFATEPSVLALTNGLKTGAHLRPGSTVWVNNRHVVPGGLEDGILINVAQRLLFFFKGGSLNAVYPVALGRPNGETPRGDFTVTQMEADPVWRVPKSIQREMAEKGKKVRTKVPPGPDNPLGKYWIGLDRGEIGIHGTIAPGSIYHFRSHGCIRMHPDDAARLFGAVTVGTPVRIIYEPVLLALLDDGRIFVEANPDAYHKAPNTFEDLRAAAKSNMISGAIDWHRAEQALRRRDGLAHDVSIASARKSGGAAWQMAAVNSPYGNQRGEAGGQQRPPNPAARQDESPQIPIPTP